MSELLKESPIGVEETTESLTGYEENEIESRFGSDIGALADAKPVMGLRALAYVMTVRDLKAADVQSPEEKAFKHVMSMTMRGVQDFWPDELPDIDPDEPVTAAGEGDDSAD